MKKLVLICWILLLQLAVFSQARVTRIITDYNGFFSSQSNNINSILPDNSHNLLGFTYNGTTYSTGVDDSKLTANGVSFVPQTFRAIPLNNVPVSGGSSYFVGLGQLYDGVHNGVNNSSSQPFQGSPVSASTLASFLTDGINGLNVGTGLANIPAGSVLQFNLGSSGISASAIGDGIPDVLFVQIADPSSVGDRLKFINSSGATVGTEFTFNLTSTAMFPRLANWRADFYNINSTQTSTSFINTIRPIVMLALDLSQLGITTSNYTQVTQLVYTTSGQSDPAFVAFNEPSVNLPTRLGISAQPTIYQTNQALNPAFQVRLLNSFDQPILQPNVAITVTVESGNGQVAGTLTQYTDANGIAFFHDLSLNGNNTHTLRFSSSSLSPAISDPLSYSTLLPLNWVSFSGQLKSSSIQLNWSTSQEQQTFDFVIERSSNSQQWQTIGQLSAAGSAQGVRQYTWNDQQPVQGSNFYRIVQRDLNSRQTTSKVIRVQYNQEAAVLVRVLSNPVIGGQLQLEVSIPTTIQLFTSSGALILTKALPAGRSSASLNGQTAGIYYLKAGKKIVPLVLQ